MPFFNFRRAPAASPAAKSGGKAGAKAAAQSQSVDALRKRAKHRLIGAVVLVLIGVLGFPLLFDTQPRPVAVDIAIEIPSKNAVKPLLLPAAVPPVGAASSAAVTPLIASPPAPPVATLRDEVIVDKKAVAPIEPTQSAIKIEAKPEPEPTPQAPAAVKAAPASDDGARAKALLDGRAAAAVPGAKSAQAEERLVVQVGAFADADKAREVRLKLERAGLKTYTQVADTKEGKRTRVRVGPFASRAEADSAASKIKGLDLPAAILTL